MGWSVGRDLPGLHQDVATLETLHCFLGPGNTLLRTIQVELTIDGEICIARSGSWLRIVLPSMVTSRMLLVSAPLAMLKPPLLWATFPREIVKPPRDCGRATRRPFVVMSH